MFKLTNQIFVITLAASVVLGVLFVLAQAVGLVMGDADLLKTMNTSWKPWIVAICSLCAVASFVLSYRRQESDGV